ncbi:GntR family transcriptional regulator [Microbacterium excoecariae]|uniref:GntR family transcriptional regulator n=1 Tax=Microbacterium excoecariae TaxID=2715210 RepID=UPI00140BC114|nr:GntR family transcriptional regulator [Microbacterium excoecariae]NHI17703.1 GntR family transcriptional regulator [Microbacterium excoecariae]
MPEPRSLTTAARRAIDGQHRRAYELIRSQIRSGWVESGGSLIESDLVTLTGLPRASIRYALARLADEGLVARQRHVGTHVVGHQYRIPIDDILPNHTPPGFMYRKLVDRRVPMVAFVRTAMDTDDREIGMCEQIFEHVTADGAEPVGLRTAYYRTSVHQPASWPTCPSLEFAFEFVFGVPLGDVETVIDAAAADEHTARTLHIAPGAPVLMREQRLLDVNGVVHEYSFAHYRADRVSFPLRDRSGRLSALLADRAATPDLSVHRAHDRAAS